MNGLLLVNLGTPAAPTAAAIRPWLRDFLSDRRVVDLPRALWLPLLYGIILPLRPRKLAPLYASIWTDAGSPLLAITRGQRAALAAALPGTPVVEAMRYGEPSVAAGLARLREAGVRRLTVLPMYPQYSGTTTASAVDALEDGLAAMAWRPELRVVDHYHDDAGYIDALAASVREHRATQGPGDLLLMSFHGIPQRYSDRGDPYEAQCRVTAARLAAALGLDAAQWQISFQSRVGKARWLQPYTEELLPQLAARGVRRLDVICPGFSADCLETLDEIAVRDARLFVESGGEALRYVPALNAQPAHIAALAQIINRVRVD